jgi:3-hydroxy-9,10-secoandrosta-1,3,5(10)-triene-9,17-dione monooxygenase
MDSADIDAAPSREEFIARAAALVPVLRARAEATERDRRIPDETIEDIRAAGLWRILKPPRYGGVVTDFGVMIDVVEEFGRGCASTSWVYLNIVAHNWMLPMWPVQASVDVWGENPEALIGSSLIFPGGELWPVKGGYQLTGRWPYCSGIDNSDWMMVGAMEPTADADGTAAPRMVVVRASDLEVIDTWHVAGLAGTGSKDTACENLFVPAHMTLDPREARGGPTPGAAGAPEPVYEIPVVTFIPHLLAGTLTGIARGAYEDFVDRLKTQVSVYNKTRIAEHTTVQLKIAEAGVLIQAAKLLVRENWKEAHRIAEAGERPTLEDRLRWRRDATHACAGCVRAVDLIYGVSGGGANYLSNEMQRHFRDMHAAAGQIHISWDINGPEYGRVAVGLPPLNKSM